MFEKLVVIVLTFVACLAMTFYFLHEYTQARMLLRGVPQGADGVASAAVISNGPPMRVFS